MSCLMGFVFTNRQHHDLRVFCFQQHINHQSTSFLFGSKHFIVTSLPVKRVHYVLGSTSAINRCRVTVSAHQEDTSDETQSLVAFTHPLSHHLLMLILLKFTLQLDLIRLKLGENIL